MQRGFGPKCDGALFAWIEEFCGEFKNFVARDALDPGQQLFHG
jgi:hypothetical protein